MSFVDTPGCATTGASGDIPPAEAGKLHHLRGGKWCPSGTATLPRSIGIPIAVCNHSIAIVIVIRPDQTANICTASVNITGSITLAYRATIATYQTTHIRITGNSTSCVTAFNSTIIVANQSTSIISTHNTTRSIAITNCAIAVADQPAYNIVTRDTATDNPDIAQFSSRTDRTKVTNIAFTGSIYSQTLYLMPQPIHNAIERRITITNRGKTITTVPT